MKKKLGPVVSSCPDTIKKTWSCLIGPSKSILPPRSWQSLFRVSGSSFFFNILHDLIFTGDACNWTSDLLYPKRILYHVLRVLKITKSDKAIYRDGFDGRRLSQSLLWNKLAHPKCLQSNILKHGIISMRTKQNKTSETGKIDQAEKDLFRP